MAIHDLLVELSHRDMIVAVRDGRLLVNAPEGGITPELQAALSEHKAQLMAMFGRTEPRPGGRAPWEGRVIPIEALPLFKASWHLMSVGSRWPNEDPRPTVFFMELA